jgi:hypothetical protein
VQHEIHSIDLVVHVEEQLADDELVDMMDDLDNGGYHHLELVERQSATSEDHQLDDDYQDKVHALVVNRNY